MSSASIPEAGAAAAGERDLERAAAPERERAGDADLLGRASAWGATDEIFPLVYAELHRLAGRCLRREPEGQTLQPTALVHEAYLRLCGDGDQSWESRAHFFGAASRAIRRILIDRARWHRRLRRGGGVRPVSLDAVDVGGADGDASRMDLLALDEALERLAAIDAQQAKVVELRFFGGLSPEETARALGISPSTEARCWHFARLWLHRELCGDAVP